MITGFLTFLNTQLTKALNVPTPVTQFHIQAGVLTWHARGGDAVQGPNPDFEQWILIRFHADAIADVGRWATLTTAIGMLEATDWVAQFNGSDAAHQHSGNYQTTTRLRTFQCLRQTWGLETVAPFSSQLEWKLTGNLQVRKKTVENQAVIKEVVLESLGPIVTD